MIPDHLVDRAWRAYTWASNTQAVRNELAYPNLRGPMPPPPDPRLSLLAALEAVAADIWDDGEEAGLDNALWKPGYEHCHVKNPYRASETA